MSSCRHSEASSACACKRCAHDSVLWLLFVLPLRGVMTTCPEALEGYPTPPHSLVVWMNFVSAAQAPISSAFKSELLPR